MSLATWPSPSTSHFFGPRVFFVNRFFVFLHRLTKFARILSSVQTTPHRTHILFSARVSDRNLMNGCLVCLARGPTAPGFKTFFMCALLKRSSPAHPCDFSTTQTSHRSAQGIRFSLRRPWLDQYAQLRWVDSLALWPKPLRTLSAQSQPVQSFCPLQPFFF